MQPKLLPSYLNLTVSRLIPKPFYLLVKPPVVGLVSWVSYSRSIYSITLV